MLEKSQYITQLSEEERLFAKLQQKAIDEFGRLSGEVWTDFNPHDPGITISDAVNYALTEIDYKLGFNLEDYLIRKEGVTSCRDMGLYNPEEIYPTAPTTAEDYRNLILATFPRVENVTVTTNATDGKYNFSLRVGSNHLGVNILKDRVRKFYNEHRNLCEDLGAITIQELTPLNFVAEIEIEERCDAEEVMIVIFYKIKRYLSGSVSIQREGIDGSTPVDEWYDGVNSNVHITTPVQRNTQSELYWHLSKVAGVRYFKYCFLRDEDGQNITDFRNGYYINIPTSFDEIIVRVGGVQVDIDTTKFQSSFIDHKRGSMYERLKRWLEREQKTEEDEKPTPSDPIFNDVAYKDFYNHYPIFNDLPSIYKTKGKDAFCNYVTLFDYVMQSGLEELDNLKSTLSLEGSYSKLKAQYFDLLERIYGIAPLMKIVRGVDHYTLDDNIMLEQRATLLRLLPSLIKDRGIAANQESPKSVATIKVLLSLLLDMSAEETTPVSNILPAHNLILIDDDHDQSWMWSQINSMLIDEDIFNSTSDTYKVAPDSPPKSEQHSLLRLRAMREGLQCLRSNFISTALFRAGTQLDNYRVVKSIGEQWILICWSIEDGSWINLGRSYSREQLEKWANTLQRYLTQLNRDSERVYVIERRFFDPSTPFTLHLLFSGWSARTASARFRSVCAELVAALAPAHIKVEIEWLSQSDMAKFEHRFFNKQEASVGDIIDRIRG